MPIRTTFKLLFGLTLILFLLNAYSLYELNLSMQTANETSEHRQELKQLGMDLAKGSDYLTNEIRSYVQFGNKYHYDNFLTEINVSSSVLPAL